MCDQKYFCSYFWNIQTVTDHYRDCCHCCSMTELCLTLWDPMDSACQASLSFITSRSLLKLVFTESVMPSNHLILCRPLLLLPSVFPSIWVFSNESALCIRWSKHWSFSFSVSPSNEYSGPISFKIYRVRKTNKQSPRMLSW